MIRGINMAGDHLPNSATTPKIIRRLVGVWGIIARGWPNIQLHGLLSIIIINIRRARRGRDYRIIESLSCKLVSSCLKIIYARLWEDAESNCNDGDTVTPWLGDCVAASADCRVTRGRDWKSKPGTGTGTGTETEAVWKNKKKRRAWLSQWEHA